MHVYLRTLVLAGFGACNGFYYAWLGLPLLPFRKHIADDPFHDQLRHQHSVEPNGCVLSPKAENQQEYVPCSLLHVLPVVRSLPDDCDCCWYPLQGHQRHLGKPSQPPCSDCLATACLRFSCPGLHLA